MERWDSLFAFHVWFFLELSRLQFFGIFKELQFRFFSDLKAVTKGNLGDLFALFWILLIGKRSLKRQWRKVDPREEHTILVRLWSEQGSWNFYIAGVTALAEVILHWNVFLIVWRNFEIFVATAVTRATAFNLFPASCITPETGCRLHWKH